MTSRRAAQRRVLEAGVAPTEQITTIVPITDETNSPTPIGPPEAPPKAPTKAPTELELSGVMLADITTRNKIVDKARADAVEARERAIHMDRLAFYAQEALTGYITRLIQSHGLDENFQYRVDLESGRVVPFRDLRQQG